MPPIDLPSKLTDETADEIVRRVAEGETIQNILGRGSKDYETKLRRVKYWCEKDRVFGERMKEARRIAADFDADEALDILKRLYENRGSNDRGLSSPVVNAAKNLADMHWKRAAANDPEKYGNKSKVEVDSRSPLDGVDIDEGIKVLASKYSSLSPRVQAQFLAFVKAAENGEVTG